MQVSKRSDFEACDPCWEFLYQHTKLSVQVLQCDKVTLSRSLVFLIVLEEGDYYGHCWEVVKVCSPKQIANFEAKLTELTIVNFLQCNAGVYYKSP